MEEILKLIFGIIFLILGVPIGNYLNNKTKDEQKKGQNWFNLLIFIGLLGGLIGLILKIDWIMFFFFFVAIVTGRSLNRNFSKRQRR